jgi:hypothetical protein
VPQPSFEPQDKSVFRFEKIGGFKLGLGNTRGYNERLSRINLYAPAHNKPFPFKSSQKANLSR